MVTLRSYPPAIHVPETAAEVVGLRPCRSARRPAHRPVDASLRPTVHPLDSGRVGRDSLGIGLRGRMEVRLAGAPVPVPAQPPFMAVQRAAPFDFHHESPVVNVHCDDVHRWQVVRGWLRKLYAVASQV